MWQNYKKKIKLTQNSKPQIVTKLYSNIDFFFKSNFDKTQKLKRWQNSKTQIVRKKQSKTQNVIKLKKKIVDQTQKLKYWQKQKKLKFYKPQKLKLWQNSKTQIVKNPKLIRSKKTIQKKKLWHN